MIEGRIYRICFPLSVFAKRSIRHAIPTPEPVVELQDHTYLRDTRCWTFDLGIYSCGVVMVNITKESTGVILLDKADYPVQAPESSEVPGEDQHIPPPGVFMKNATKLVKCVLRKDRIESVNPLLYGHHMIFLDRWCLWELNYVIIV